MLQLMHVLPGSDDTDPVPWTCARRSSRYGAPTFVVVFEEQLLVLALVLLALELVLLVLALALLVQVVDRHSARELGLVREEMLQTLSASPLVHLLTGLAALYVRCSHRLAGRMQLL